MRDKTILTKMWAFLVTLSLLLMITNVVKADSIKFNENESQITYINKSDVINSYVAETGVSYETAKNMLFPNEHGTSLYMAGDKDVRYVRLMASGFSYSTLNSYLPGDAGLVYFYCEVSVSGQFRGIRRIVYAGYNPGNLVFSGNFQYHLENAGKIHYTISGGLYSNTTTTNSVGSGVGIGGVGSVNVSVSSTSNFVRSILYHGNRYY